MVMGEGRSKKTKEKGNKMKVMMRMFLMAKETNTVVQTRPLSCRRNLRS